MNGGAAQVLDLGRTRAAAKAQPHDHGDGHDDDENKNADSQELCHCRNARLIEFGDALGEQRLQMLESLGETGDAFL